MPKRKKPSGGNAGVGYGRPPQNTRFKKGQSGNPKGRPKGSKNLANLLVESVNERVTVTENGKSKRITKLAAMHKQLANKGALGDLRAAELLFRKLEPIEKKAEVPSEDLDQADREVVKGLLERLKHITGGGGDEPQQG